MTTGEARQAIGAWIKALQALDHELVVFERGDATYTPFQTELIAIGIRETAKCLSINLPIWAP